MNILVTGANGQLGCSLRAAVAQGNDGTKACIGLEDNWFYFADISRREGYPVYFLDITDPEEIGRTVRDYQIDAIINADTAGPVCLELMSRTSQIIDATYSKFMHEIWA